jgi:hypothetical protein
MRLPVDFLRPWENIEPFPASGTRTGYCDQIVVIGGRKTPFPPCEMNSALQRHRRVLVRRPSMIAR